MISGKDRSSAFHGNGPFAACMLTPPKDDQARPQPFRQEAFATMAHNENQIPVKYVIPDNLPDLYVSGAWGGISWGKVHLHFFSERNAIPKGTGYVVSEGNIAEAPQLQQGPKAPIVRLVQSSIVMDLPTAINVRDWLTDKIDRLIQASQGGEKVQ